MEQNGPDSGDMLLAWARIVVEKWHDKYVQLGIGKHAGGKDSSGELEKSLTASMIDAGSDPNKIEFLVKLYGIFVDMGVGREISRGNSGDVGFKVKRKPQPWNSSVWFKQLYILRKLLAEKYGNQIASALIAQLNDVVREYRSNSLTAMNRKIKTTN